MTSAGTAQKPLVHGERLPREEFLARWYGEPWRKGAELFDGIVYLPERVSLSHDRFHADGPSYNP